MRKFGKELTNIDTPHRQEGYSGIVSSLGEDGKTANIGNMNGSQIRGTKILLPYGIACVGMSGMNTHVMLDGNNSYINGMYDHNRPATVPGELVLYSSGGAMIKLKTDGSISVTGNVEINGNVIVTGDIAITGDVAITGGFTVNGRTPRYN